MKKKELRAAKKYTCECIDCGHTVQSDEHCNQLTCSECGGQMRRKERPGPGRSFRHSSTVISPEPQWNSIAVDKLPENAFIPGKAGRDYPHHWVKGGEADKAGHYISGDLYLSKGGLIEAMRQAKKQKAGKEVIDHLKAHIQEAGIEIREEKQANIYEGITGEIDMKGTLPTVGEIDLNRIVARIETNRARSGDDIEQPELDQINLLARTNLDKKDIYVFPVWASNDLVDAYFTRMDRATTLQNYVSDFNSGRALMLSHGESLLGGSAADNMPIGSSFSGRITARDDADGSWVEAWLYILRGIEIGGIKTDDAIRMVEAGIWKRVSIGFSIQSMEGRPAGKYLCNICGNDLMSNDCEHLPGREYDGKMCIANVIGAGLREVSLVYMNAAQGTVVQKARSLAESGALSDKEILGLESFYGVRFYDIGLDKPGSRGSKIDPHKVPKTERNEQKENIMEEIRAILLSITDLFSKAEKEGSRVFSDLTTRMEKSKDEAGLTLLTGDLSEAVQGVLADSQDARAIMAALPEDSRTVEAVKSLIASAADGKGHRTAILTDTLAEGVRFEGKAFDTEQWTRVLGSLTVEQLSHQRDLWKTQADAKLKAGQTARDTGDGGIDADQDKDKDQRSATETGLPDEAYDDNGQSHI